MLASRGKSTLTLGVYRPLVRRNIYFIMFPDSTDHPGSRGCGILGEAAGDPVPGGSTLV